MKKYAERSEAKKKYRTIKRGPKKLNFGASKPGVRGGPGPLGPPLDPLVQLLHVCRPHVRKDIEKKDRGKCRKRLHLQGRRKFM